MRRDANRHTCSRLPSEPSRWSCTHWAFYENGVVALQLSPAAPTSHLSSTVPALDKERSCPWRVPEQLARVPHAGGAGDVRGVGGLDPHNSAAKHLAE